MLTLLTFILSLRICVQIWRRQQNSRLQLEFMLALQEYCIFLEAQMGIEPMHNGFADRSVTSSPLRLTNSLRG